jgi:hypothetical protein
VQAGDGEEREALMNPIWMILISHDDGRKWKLDQPYRPYKNHERAVSRAAELNRTAVRLKFMVVEYRPCLVIEER